MRDVHKCGQLGSPPMATTADPTTGHHCHRHCDHHYHHSDKRRSDHYRCWPTSVSIVLVLCAIYCSLVVGWTPYVSAQPPPPPITDQQNYYNRLMTGQSSQWPDRPGGSKLPDESSRCYDHRNRPQRCVPEFVNAAYQVPVEATNTCGQSGGSVEFCVQTGATGSSKKTCELCDATNRSTAHPAIYLTDYNDGNEMTWWQSETMFEGIQYPNRVNITLHLGKAFDITYVRLKFHSPRPESFAIFKRFTEDGPWIPFQYYSATCLSKYNVTDSVYANRDDETKALCTKEFSDISPLTGGNVIFTTLEGRPSAVNFEDSSLLQEFVTATDIRITLDRMNTFGDEIFGDPQVLKSYYYAISDLSIGGICKCNGHANECFNPPGQRTATQRRLICRCEHNTGGPDCNECLPFYNDQPWRRATAKNAYECKPCNCNGRSNRCFFDRDLWLKTGHGGHCSDCADFTSGPNCERCRDNYYTAADNRCLACNCDPIGSISLQCIGTGQCICKPGVEGQRCDRCAANHYDFSMTGCRSCGCNLDGSWNNSMTCDQGTGDCRCKQNVEGQQCDKCKNGHFALRLDNEFGCLPCFCYGHSTQCTTAPGFSMHTIESTFSRDTERWSARDRTGRDMQLNFEANTKSVSVLAHSREPVYVVAPDKYLGDQRASYNQFLSFSLRIGQEGPRATVEDIVLEGAGLIVSQPIFGQGNPLPNTRSQQYKFRLHEDVRYGWAPRLGTKDFISVLSNMTALRIRVTYSPAGTGSVSDVRLESAQQLPYNERATWIEMCTCPEGYVGQYCESCAPGYKHDPPGGGSFSQCIPCNCNNHAEYCDPDTGRCICEHNTAGDNCEVCGTGYYGNALTGTEKDCESCPCPQQGACVVLPDEAVACLQCPEGYAGYQCDVCVDGYSGDPMGRHGGSSACSSCQCNGNIDLNGVGNCNTTTGECLKCIYNTEGYECEKCKQGFYGSALAHPKGDCKACNCHPFGTHADDRSVTVVPYRIPSYSLSYSSLLSQQSPLLCNQANGQCNCKPNVMGRQCNVCVEGYWDLSSGEGCKSCDCDPIGSFNRTCDDHTGQCHCKPGTTGKHCGVCLPLHFGFSAKGCTRCDCDPIGSTGPQCDDRGQCPCRPNVEGRRCERCRENKYNKEAGCLDCPACYTLVQDAVTDHRMKLTELTNLLEEIERNPQVVEDLNFERQLKEVNDKVTRLLDDARRAQGSDGSLIAQLETLKDRIRRVQETTGRIAEQSEHINLSAGYGDQNITLAEQIIDRANEALSQARRFLDSEGMSALEKAQQRSDRFGQQSQRMSEIAREARTLADRHETEATDIEHTSREALNTSDTAFRLAKDAIDTQEANRMELKRITDQLEDTTDLLLRTEKMSEEANRGATKAHADALAMYTDVNAIVVPQLPSDRYRLDAIDIIEQAKRLIKDADDLLERHGNTLNNTKYQLKDARDLLEEAMRQQKITDELLASVDAALQKAKQAVAGGERILEDAKQTLKTLKEFDATVKESKSRADEALKKVPEIESLITDAEGKTTDAEQALEGALTDAIEARDVAKEAQRIAEKASDDADRIRGEAGHTKNRAGILKGQAEELAAEVDETNDKMKGYEDQAKTDEGLAKDALAKANQAKTSAQDAARKVAESAKTVDGILGQLEGLDDIDATLLEDLERRLAKAEQELKDADLDNKMGELKNIRDDQNRWMRDYDDEIEKLRRDVANIADIRSSLPDGCFRRLKLEP